MRMTGKQSARAGRRHRNNERKGIVIMKYGNEGMDCKKYFLLFLGKVWFAALAALLGGVLGGGIYLFSHVAINNNREYQAESKIYLTFAPDESGEIYQAYNGYTWNDLMATEPILNTTMAFLPEDYTEEEVIAATRAEILSDLRLLTITITTSNPDRTAEILKATNRSLVELGKQAEEFRGIEIYRETEPKLVTMTPRLLQAVLVGLALALVSALLAMALFYVLDDKIYVPGDLKCVTELPFVGFCFGEEPGKTAKSGREERLSENLRADFEQNRAHLTKKTGTLTTFHLEKHQTVAEEMYDKLRESAGVLLAVPYGKMDRTTLRYRIEQFSLQECRLAGIIIQDADTRLLKWYYNHL